VRRTASIDISEFESDVCYFEGGVKSRKGSCCLVLQTANVNGQWTMDTVKVHS
jgi:hypothetical protein